MHIRVESVRRSGRFPWRHRARRFDHTHAHGCPCRHRASTQIGWTGSTRALFCNTGSTRAGLACLATRPWISAGPRPPSQEQTTSAQRDNYERWPISARRRLHRALGILRTLQGATRTRIRYAPVVDVRLWSAPVNASYDSSSSSSKS